MAKKSRLTDTIAGAIKAASEASKPLPEPPEFMPLRPKDRPFWDLIVRARAREEWEGPQIVVGVQLAMCQADIKDEQGKLDAEGAVVYNERGTPIRNPRFTVIESLTSRQQNLMRSMALNATATTRAADLQKKRGPEKKARSLADEIAGEGEALLA